MPSREDKNTEDHVFPGQMAGRDPQQKEATDEDNPQVVSGHTPGFHGSQAIPPTTRVEAPLPTAQLQPLKISGEEAPGPPGLTFNGYTLQPSTKLIPEEFIRISSGTSIAEPGSILDPESGRTYHNHNTGRYFLPNDAAEQDRLDLQHKLFTLYHYGKLYEAPITNPANVLDIATGTGIWPIQFARQHPEANIIGTDLSLIQPANAPANCSFVKENSEYDDWIFPQPFDFVFMRMVFTCFDNHLTVIKKSFDNLRPGGWIEMQDLSPELICTDGSVAGSYLERWAELMYISGKAAGRDFYVAKRYKELMIEAGFVDVVEDVGPLPGNPWPEGARYFDLGRWEMTNTIRGVRGVCFRLFREMGMPPEEIEDFVEKVKRDVTNADLHFCWPMYTVYGRKPYPDETV